MPLCYELAAQLRVGRPECENVSVGLHASDVSTLRASVKHEASLERAVLVVYGNRMSLGRRVAARRGELGLSQKQLADLVGVAQTTISKWEKDKSEPSRAEARRLATSLKISHWELEGLTTGKKERTLPLMGYVGAGSQIYDLDPQEIDRVEMPPGGQDGDVAFIIRGASMAPFIEGGLIVARPVEDLTAILYRLAVVTLEDDRQFFKRILPSPVVGSYVLARVDGEIEERDVQIKHAALFRVYVEPH